MFNIKINKGKLKFSSHVVLLLCCVQLLSSPAKSQGDINSITTLFNNYQQNHLQEKIFAHTDKIYYLSGEIMWFKLYNVDAGFNRPLDLSKVAYVEILDAANKPVLQAKTALKNGDGSGSFFLPLSIGSGNYKFRAYTNWMKNYGAASFFEKNITIVNTQRAARVSSQDSLPKYDIQFFPEGGNLVAGIESKIAFKAVDQHGKGIDFDASLTDNNRTVLQFEPAHAGMGNFIFTPQQNHTYKATIKLPGGQFVTKELPPIYTEGYVMNLEERGDNMIINVRAVNVPSNEVYLFVHSNASVENVQSKTLTNGNTSFTFDRSILGDGISHITLFNSNKQPVCERLYFKKPEHLLEIALSADKANYSTRNKVNLNIQLDNTAPSKDSASMSVSVYKIDSLQSMDKNTIETYLLLTSELKGYVEEPAYYFEGNDKATAADNLVLTQGWRRFNWDSILKNEKPVFNFVPEYNGHIITGTVINTRTGKPMGNIESFVSVQGTRLQFNPSLSDSDGHVKFEMKEFYGSSEISVQAGTQFDSVYRVEINNPFSENYSVIKLPPFNLPASSPATLLERSIAMQVQDIYSGEKLRRFPFSQFDSTTFYLHADKTYLLDDYTRFTTLEEVLREYVALVGVTKREGQYHFPVYNYDNKQFYQVDPLNLLDGVPVFNFTKFLNVDPLQIRKLDVIHQRYIYGGSSFSGILNWTTYKGDLANYKQDASTVVIDYDALQLQREFYAPVYNNEEQRASHLPDFRNVLSWSPEIKIKNGSTQQLSFYTSDLPGKYAVQIQGLSAKGECGSKTIFVDVKK